MRQNKVFTIGSLCLLGGITLLSGCSDSDFVAGNENNTRNEYVYYVTADADKGGESGVTRSLQEGTGNVITSTWEKGDQLMAYSLSDNDMSKATSYSLLVSETSSTAGGFAGEFKTVNPIAMNDELAFFYPGASSVGTDSIIVPVVAQKGDGKEAPLLYHERQGTIKKLLELNIRQQDGKITTIGKKFDFQWAKTKPTSITGTDVKVNVGHMQRKIAIWGLRFADKNGNILTSVDSLSISNVRSSDIFDLGTGEFIADNSSDETNHIMIKPSGTEKISSAGGKYTYVAVLPGTFNDVLVMAYVGNTCYARTYSSVSFEQDRIYRTDVLQMEEVVPNPYVEVQGVKWATGNFIHYSTSTDGEYWGVAPTQWWISDYAVGMVSSQFVKNYSHDTEDLDLFRYGDIAEALKLNSDRAMTGTGIRISKKFYDRTGSLARTVTQDKATYGDIVWYYTNDDNQKYRLPTEAEILTLFNEADVIPGYCYTDKGTKVYGAYFYTRKSGSARVQTFPTGRRRLYKYNNVTSLVRANKGLFLPVAGKRNNFSSNVGYRDMSDFSAYGQYMCDYSRTSGLAFNFFFGPTEWNFSANASGMAQSIRPVWDESSTAEPNPVYEPFRGIR